MLSVRLSVCFTITLGIILGIPTAFAHCSHSLPFILYSLPLFLTVTVMCVGIPLHPSSLCLPAYCAVYACTCIHRLSAQESVPLHVSVSMHACIARARAHVCVCRCECVCVGGGWRCSRKLSLPAAYPDPNTCHPCAKRQGPHRCWQRHWSPRFCVCMCV